MTGEAAAGRDVQQGRDAVEGEPHGDAERPAQVATEEGQWFMTARPRRTAVYAWSASAVVMIVAIVSAVFMTEEYTGVYFRIWDRLSLIVIGLFICSGLLLFARPRLRVGAAGVAVRNFVSERFVEWDRILRITFPPGARFARIDLPDDEYLPVLAIQINDRARAVDAIKAFRALQAEYTGPVAPPRS